MMLADLWIRYHLSRKNRNMGDKENTIIGNQRLYRQQHLHEHFFNHLAGSKSNYQKSINQATSAILEFLEERDTPFTGIPTDQLMEKFSQVFIGEGNELTLRETLEELKELYLNDAVAFHHPKYVAHLNCPILIPALAAEMIISSVNSSMDTWDQSIGATLIELKLIEWTLTKIGYPHGADGVFTSGGTQSNLMGLLLARDHFIKESYKLDPKTEGIPAEAGKFRILCSEISHFSLKKSASLLGLGQKSIVPIPVDRQYKMDVISLNKAIHSLKAQGNIPIAIVGTAGTTDFGSIDPLAEIAKIAREHNVWFHVDAAYGGGLILSDQHRPKLNGIEQSDSATIDYHKTFFQPVSSSGFFMRDKKFIRHISYYADYLNSKEQEADGVPNMVKKSIQTTRRFDALKLWMTLRVTGVKRLGQCIDHVIDLAEKSADLLEKDDAFELLNTPEMSAIVFRFIPLEKKLSPGQASHLNAHIRKCMFSEGHALLASTKINDEVYLKFTLLNPLTQLEDIREIIALIKKHAMTYFNNSLKTNTPWKEPMTL